MIEGGKRILVLGATSSIAEAVTRIWAKDGGRFVLVGRNRSRLEAVGENLRVLGANDARAIVLDCAKVQPSVELPKIVAILGGLDLVLLAYGVLGNQELLEADPLAVDELIRTNFTSATAWCLAVSAVLKQQRSGA